MKDQMLLNDSMESSAETSPVARYHRDLAREGFQYDAAQEQAISLLQRLYDDLLVLQRKGVPQAAVQEPTLSRKKGIFAKLRRRPSIPVKEMTESSVKGLYLWGGVGRGKTYLVDTFYACVPGDRKLRIHFHRFMQRVHQDLMALQGQKNPLQIVGRQFAEEYDLICFDEFFVSDITDAMILAGILEAIFKEGVVLVATSNILPARLYENGLQRDRFLPAIALLEQSLEIYNLDGGVDYRLRALEQAEMYHFPLDEQSRSSLQSSFDSLAPEPGVEGGVIIVESREIPVIRYADGILWCEFVALCDGPRSQNDYIEIARIYSEVLVSNVPQFTGLMDDQARRFINMVDEFYDRSVKLIVSAAVEIDEIYAGTQLTFEFLRTKSRLLEMQSHEYLEKPHLP